MSPDQCFAILSQNGMALSPAQCQQLLSWASLFKEWNQKHNLVSKNSIPHFWEVHALHSLAAFSVIQIPPNQEVLDLGTGGGLPGIPLAILRPDLNVVMMDSTRKKIDAVQGMIEGLQLSNASAVWGRSEELGMQPKYRQRFDWILAKAVSALKNLEQWTRTIRTPTACLWAYKGGDLKQEMKEFLQLNKFAQVQEFLLSLEGYSELATQEKKIVQVQYSAPQRKYNK